VKRVLDPEQLARPRTDGRRLARLLATAVLGAVALTLVTSAMAPPDFVDRDLVVNDSPYDVVVEVSQGQGTPVLGLGTVPQRRSIAFDAVLDQADSWAFHFTYGGEEGGTLVVGRSALEGDGWTVPIPRAVQSQLERKGLPPSPATRT